jgi:hypothetical protein
MRFLPSLVAMGWCRPPANSGRNQKACASTYITQDGLASRKNATFSALLINYFCTRAAAMSEIFKLGRDLTKEAHTETQTENGFKSLNLLQRFSLDCNSALQKTGRPDFYNAHA